MVDDVLMALLTLRRPRLSSVLTEGVGGVSSSSDEILSLLLLLRLRMLLQLVSVEADGWWWWWPLRWPLTACVGGRHSAYGYVRFELLWLASRGCCCQYLLTLCLMEAGAGAEPVGDGGGEQEGEEGDRLLLTFHSIIASRTLCDVGTAAGKEWCVRQQEKEEHGRAGRYGGG